MTDQTPCKTPVEIFPLIVMPMQMSHSAMTTLLWEPCKNLSLENYVHANEIFSMDHHCCTTTAVWLQWSCRARNSFPWLSQEILMCTGKKKTTSGCNLQPTFIFDLQALTYHYIWPAGSDLPLYLTCRLWPTIIFDLKPSGLPLYFTWPASSALPLYLTCKIWPTFIFYLTCTLWTTFVFDLYALTYLHI